MFFNNGGHFGKMKCPPPKDGKFAGLRRGGIYTWW
jgi:hypothetical protein